MDDLQTIKKLSSTQMRIREALRNVPPLKITKPSMDKGFVVIDDQLGDKSGQKSLLDRFLMHKTLSEKNVSNSESPTKRTGSSAHKWSQLKNSMTQELETKRLETEKEREMNDKLENEELEEVDELDDVLNDIDNNEDIDETNEDVDKGLDVDGNDGISDEEVVESDGEADNENDDEEDNESDAEEEGSDRELNPFIDDEAEDDDEEEETNDQNVSQRAEGFQSKDFCDNKEKELISIEDKVKVDDNPRESQSLAEEECDDNPLNDSILNTSVISLDESFERRCATQKIALSPFITQKLKPRLDSNEKILKLIPSFEQNVESNEDFDSQTLLGLCSGNFIQNENQMKESEEKSQTNEVESEEEDNEVMSGTQRSAKKFNIESDGESDSEENVENKVLKPDLKTEISLKSFNESDGEELVVTETSDEEGEDIHNSDSEEEVEEQDVRKISKGFFEDEAELSGSDDVSSDEDEGEDGDYDHEEGEQEDLPSDSEIRNQIERIHNKKLLDEDKRQLMILKEMVFEDGDLHDDNDVRQKKFRWNFNENDTFVNDYINEDSEGEYVDSDDEKNIKTPALKMFVQNSETNGPKDDNLEKLKSKLNRNLDLKTLNKNNAFESTEKKVVRIESFVVRDERLKTLCTTKRSVTTDSHSFKSNKKFKSSKKNNTKVSVFDLFQQN